MLVIIAIAATWIIVCVVVNTTRYHSLEEGLRVTFTGKASPEAREAMLNRNEDI